AGIIEVTPTPEWVEVLQSEPDRIDDAVAAGAGRIRTVRFGALAEIQAGILHGVLLIQWRHIHRRGRWGLAEDILEDPFPAPDRTGAVRHGGDGEHAREGHDAATIAVAEGDASPLRALHIGVHAV